MKLEHTLVGEKVTLRKMEKYDMVHSLEFAKHKKEVMQYLYMDWGNATAEEQIEVLKGWEKSEGNIPCAIDENCTGEHIGNCDFRFSFGDKRCHIGLLIGVPSCQGKGYGTEIVKIMRDYAFAENDVNRLELFVQVENERAIACYKKCGFVHEGTLRDYYIKRNKTQKPVSVHMMSILKDEWKKLTKNGKQLAYETEK